MFYYVFLYGASKGAHHSWWRWFHQSLWWLLQNYSLFIKNKIKIAPFREEAGTTSSQRWEHLGSPSLYLVSSKYTSAVLLIPPSPSLSVSAVPSFARLARSAGSPSRSGALSLHGCIYMCVCLCARAYLFYIWFYVQESTYYVLHVYPSPSFLIYFVFHHFI